MMIKNGGHHAYAPFCTKLYHDGAYNDCVAHEGFYHWTLVIRKKVCYFLKPIPWSEILKYFNKIDFDLAL